jgi:hypothetical protein
LRFYGTRFAIDWIGADFLKSQNIPGRDPNIFHVAVVNFGDTAEVALDWETITPTDDAAQAAQVNDIAQDVRTDRNFGNTNFVEAFEQAANLFDQRGPPPTDCPQRAVIVLTDGRPAVDQPDFSVAGHMNEVQQIVNNRMTNAQVFVTAINDPNDLEYWNLTENYWRTITRDDTSLDVRGAELVRNNDEIGARLTDILSWLTGRVVDPITPGPYVVAPYLQELCLIFYKRDPQTENLVVVDQNGTPVDENYPDTQVTGRNQPIETICTERPQPGEWNVNTTTGRPDVIIDAIPIPAGGVLRAPTGTSARQFKQIPVEFQLIDQSGNPLPEYADPRYAIQLTATIRTANRIWDVTPSADPQQSFSASFVPVESGEHTLNVYGRTQDVNGSVIDVIKGDVGSFLVESVAATLIDDPRQGGRCPTLQQAEPVTLAYAFQTPDSQNVSIDVPVNWQVTLEGNGEPTDLTMQTPDVTGVYSTTFPPEEPGTYTLNVVATITEPVQNISRKVKEQELTLEVTPTDPVTFTITRPDAGQVRGQQLRFQWQPWFYQLAPLPLEVAVQLKHGQTGDPVDTTNISAGSLDQLLTVEVRDLNTGQLISQIPPFQPMGDPGRLQAQVHDLDLGQYLIQVRPATPQTLQCGWAWATETHSVEITRVRDRTVYLVWLMLGSLMAAVAFTGYRFWSITRHPMRGWLVLINDRGQRVGSTFALAGRNQRVFKSGIQADTGVKQLRVYNKPGWEQDDRIQVQYRIAGRKAFVTSPPITPRGNTPLENGYTLKYFKDYQDITDIPTA